MTGLQKTTLFLMASFAVYLALQPFVSNWRKTLRKQVCLHRQKWGSYYYLNSFTTKNGQLTYSFSGMCGDYFWRRITPQHMQLLLENIKTIRDDIDSGSYQNSPPYREAIDKDNSLYKAATFCVFKQYRFISFVRADNKQKYHLRLFDVFICDSSDGHFAVFKPLTGHIRPRIIRFSLQDMRNICEQVIEAFEGDFASN